MPVKTTQSEADIQREILRYLATRQDVWVMRVNSGTTMDGWALIKALRAIMGARSIAQAKSIAGAAIKRAYMVKLAPTGTSDIVGWYATEYYNSPAAVFLAIEVKRPGGKPTQAQQEFLDKVNEAGGLGFVATSVQDAMDQLGEPG